jgi:glycosyltransferase involved in cell wall biosynthesis
LLRQPSLMRLFAINPSVAGPAGRRLAGRLAEKLCYLPDPAEQRVTMNRALARSRLGLRDDQTALLIFGALTERKGIRELLGALRDHWPAQLSLILAGAQDNAIRTLLAEPHWSAEIRRGRLIVRDFIHDDDDEALVYAASDMAWLGYIGHRFVSGVMVAAGRAGLPMITSDEGEIGYLARTHGIGIAINPHDPNAIRDGLRLLLQPVVRQDCARAASAFFARHAPKDFAERLLTRLMTEFRSPKVRVG